MSERLRADARALPILALAVLGPVAAILLWPPKLGGVASPLLPASAEVPPLMVVQPLSVEEAVWGWGFAVAFGLIVLALLADFTALPAALWILSRYDPERAA